MRRFSLTTRFEAHCSCWAAVVLPHATVHLPLTYTQVLHTRHPCRCRQLAAQRPSGGETGRIFFVLILNNSA